MEFSLEAPGGVVAIRAKCANGQVLSITLQNVPSFVALKGVIVDVPELGKVPADVVYSGMWYCVVRTADIPTTTSQENSEERQSLMLRPSNAKTLCRLGEMIKIACREQHPVNHPFFDYPGCDILVFRGDSDEATTAGKDSRSVVSMTTRYCI